MQIYLSRFVVALLIVAAPFITVFILFLVWLAVHLRLDAHLPNLGLLALAASGMVFSAAVVVIWRELVKMLRWGRKPVLAFDNAGISYTRNLCDIEYLPYAEICGVDFGDFEGRRHCLLIHRRNAAVIGIFTTNLGASADEIFSEFKKHLPDLIQPYKIALRLVAVAK